MNGLVLLPMLRFPFVFNSRFWQLRGIQEISLTMVEIKKPHFRRSCGSQVLF